MEELSRLINASGSAPSRKNKGFILVSANKISNENPETTATNAVSVGKKKSGCELIQVGQSE